MLQNESWANDVIHNNCPSPKGWIIVITVFIFENITIQRHNMFANIVILRLCDVKLHRQYKSFVITDYWKNINKSVCKYTVHKIINYHWFLFSRLLNFIVVNFVFKVIDSEHPDKIIKKEISPKTKKKSRIFKIFECLESTLVINCFLQADIQMEG